MSQNGPYSGQPWGHGSSDEPYSEPADPWGDQGSMPDDSSWGGHQQQVPPQPFPYHSPPSTGSPMWGQPPPPPPRRNTSMVALVITLGVLICIGLGATAWLLNERSRHKPQAQVSSSSATNSGPAPQGSEDARFYVKEGDCVINEGTDAKPEMKVTPCTSGTYKVLKQIKGTTTGVKDAEAKCAKVPGYTKWYYYDSPLDDLDFVLCLKEE
jgi:hypothetical protein